MVVQLENPVMFELSPVPLLIGAARLRVRLLLEISYDAVLTMTGEPALPLRSMFDRSPFEPLPRARPPP